jgi:surfactin synthase thioesterase subunit
MSKINLFGLPFSGGSKYSYKEFGKHVPSFINFIPLEIPGRGARASETLLTDIQAISDDVFKQVKDKLSLPYAIYGHSLGGILGYLLIRQIIKAGLNQPLHLFVTGCGGPAGSFSDNVDYRLPTASFFQKISELGGSPNEVLQNPALMEFFEPILRADFEAVDNFKYTAGTPFNIPVSVVLGTEEQTTYEEGLIWQQETSLPVDVKQMNGGHFFIFGNEDKIMKMISDKLEAAVVNHPSTISPCSL